MRGSVLCCAAALAGCTAVVDVDALQAGHAFEYTRSADGESCVAEDGTTLPIPAPGAWSSQQTKLSHSELRLSDLPACAVDACGELADPECIASNCPDGADFLACWRWTVASCEADNGTCDADWDRLWCCALGACEGQDVTTSGCLDRCEGRLDAWLTCPPGGNTDCTSLAQQTCFAPE